MSVYHHYLLCLGDLRRVYKASYEHSNGRKEIVALKKVRMEAEKEGVCFYPCCVVDECLTVEVNSFPSLLCER